ncbi:hypothetical protein SAMN04489717_1522 [Actinopolymorpha singaporensis]|uniref:Uncharacterized protein n=1 Tax=Actinopolymorpha singaporensis TaxID=117157 RepID=A0A1H1P7H2_9ACTN|nr:hypothetical protein SAMN04489717_1522 [Actinopolymorpha singaporensis]
MTSHVIPCPRTSHGGRKVRTLNRGRLAKEIAGSIVPGPVARAASAVTDRISGRGDKNVKGRG